MQHFSTATHMSDEIVLTRMMTALDLEFEKAMHYHDEGYESHNDYRHVSNPTPQPNQLKMPPEPEPMELDILENIQDLLDVCEKILSNIDA